MEKIIFLGAGSDKDPGFDGTYDKDALLKKGIKIVDPVVIESCHGCPDLMRDYSRQMQSLVEKGHKVVGVHQGGRYFALPSIQATEVTFPIVSCPLDLVAYQAFMVPGGHAAIATVGVERMDAEEPGKYQTIMRSRAIFFAENILSSESDSVQLKGPNLGKLVDELSKFCIKLSDDSRLVLTYDSVPYHFNYNPAKSFQIWADSKEDPLSWHHLGMAENTISHPYNKAITVQTSGATNLAIYAAKILSLNNPDLRDRLLEIRDKKRASYAQTPRNLADELSISTF
jgi:phosphoribosylcarboxyaminoimidazole (NCAIR) mutase